MEVPYDFQVCPARVQPALHHRWQYKVIVDLLMVFALSVRDGARTQALVAHICHAAAAVAWYLKLSSYFKDCPGHPGVLGRDRDGRAPEAAAGPTG